MTLDKRVEEIESDYERLLSDLLDVSSFGSYVRSAHHAKIKEWLRTTLQNQADKAKRDIETVEEIVRSEFYKFNDSEPDFKCNQRVLKLRNDIQKAIATAYGINLE